MVATLGSFTIRVAVGGVVTLVVFTIVVDEKKGHTVGTLGAPWNIKQIEIACVFILPLRSARTLTGKHCLVNNCRHTWVFYYKGRRWRGGHNGRLYDCGR